MKNDAEGLTTDVLTAPSTVRTPNRWQAAVSWIVSDAAQAARVRDHALHHKIGVTAVFAQDVAQDMDCADMLDFLAADAQTRVVFVELSNVKRPAAVISAAHACMACKPVFGYFVTPESVDAALYEAFVIRTGIVRVKSSEALLELFEQSESQGVHTGPIADRYRARLARERRTPPLPAPDIRGLRERHTRVGRLLDQALADVAKAEVSAGRIDRIEDVERIKGREDIDGVSMRSIHLNEHATHAVFEVFGMPVGNEEIPDAMRLEIQVRDDPQFGALMTIDGATERTLTFLLPLDATLTDEVFEDIPAFSAHTPRERAVAVYALESLSLLVCGQPRITEVACTLSLNGEKTHWQNLDMHIAISGERASLSICPYPFEFEESVDWNGMPLTFRPIRPEDETLHAGLFSAQTQEDLYLRFFSMQRSPDHARLARLVRIDYAREMAIIACSGEPGSQTVHGVSRAVAGPGNRSAEFAVAIRSDEKGHHLGRMLMDRIIAYSRRHGTRLLEGIVLKENRRMLALALDCGFQRYPNEDPTVWSVRLDLQAGESA